MTHSPSIAPFGLTPAGQPVSLITLKNDLLACEIITYGAAVRALRVPDRSGTLTDVVLGYDTLADYMTQDGYMGAIVGRFANRIAGGRFSLNATEYKLARNDGNNHLHGGNVGFSHRVWEIESIRADSVALTLTSPDGEEGYPGTLRVRVTYSLCRSSLSIRYEAAADKDTPCSLTNHSYFNLAGHDGGSVLDQEITVMADYFTPSNCESIPTGDLLPVEGTVFDLRASVPIGAHINTPHPQLLQARGYDHNFVLRGTPGTLRPAARAFCAKTGITMLVSTTLPGLHFYTANYISPGRCGKEGCHYGPRHAFCLETQHFPDSPNRPAFPSPILKAGETYDHTTCFSFSLQD